jgi:WD40 repeat protein
LRCNKKEDNSLTPIHSIQSAHSVSSIKPGKSGSCKNTYRPSPISTALFYDEHFLVSSGAIDSHIKLWDLRKTYSISKKIPDPIPVVSFNPQTNQNKGYSNLVFNHSYTRFYANCMNNSIYEFDINDFHRIQSINGPNHTNMQLKDIAVFNKHKNTSNFIKSCVSLCDNFLLTGSSDTIGYIYPLKYREKYPHVCLEAHFSEVTAVDWCPHDFNQLITCSDDNTIRIWNVKKELNSEDEAKCDLKQAKVGELELSSSENNGNELNEDFFRILTKKTCPNLNNILYARDLVFPIKKNYNLFENLLVKTPIKISNWKTPTENLPINLIEIKVTPAKQVVKAKILTKREDNIVQLSVAKKRTIDSLFNDLLINNEDTPSSKRRLFIQENNQSTHVTTPKTPRNRNTNRVRQAATPHTPSSSVSKSILDYFSPRNLLK